MGAEGRKLAVLIDAENISSKYIKIVLDEATNNGNIILKRIYGDWTSNSMAPWRDVILDNSIQPIQQYRYTGCKNASDSAMIIDAMDLMYSGRLEGFCIVSSDSDFTRLAARLRENELFVIGMGEQKTPKSFINACDKFIYLDLVSKGKSAEKKTVDVKKADDSAPPAPAVAKAEKNGAVEANAGSNRKNIIQAIKEQIDENSDLDGWILSSKLGTQLQKRFPDFNSKNFGYSKFSSFIKSLEPFEVKKGTSSDLLIRIKPGKE